MNRRSRSRWILIGCAVVVLALDQLTKAWVVANLPLYTPTNLVESLAPILSLTFVKNTGVAFGLFPQLGAFFTVLQAIVILGILYYQRTLPPDELWLHVSLGLVVGGALGNLVDRLTRGYVVDFFDVNLWPLHTWPVFNIADSAIVMGVMILLIDSFVEQQDERKDIAAEARSAEARSAGTGVADA